MKIYVNNENSNILPQANSIYKVIDICLALLKNSSGLSQNELMELLEVNSTRQIKYYKDAAFFLGFLDISKDKLSDIGKMVFSQSNEILLKLILYKVLENKVFAYYYKQRDKDNLREYILNNYKLSITTIERRINTIENWVLWCDYVLNDYPEENFEIIF